MIFRKRKKRSYSSILLRMLPLPFLFLLLSLSANAQVYVMNTFTVTTCSGTFLDPGGNADYPLGNTSTMTIAPGVAGQFITVNFAWFDIQQDWDVLYAYDGTSAAAPLIGIFSGNVSPGLLSASTANASGSLTFRFVSNWWTSGPEPGWSATIACSATGGTPRYAMKNGGSYTVCSGTFYDSGGATHSYTWNENSTMTFCPATAGNGIQLDFGPIDLEQDWDLLKIYDGPNTSSPLIAGFGNSDNVVLPAQTITASTTNTTGCLTASFVSDGWWQNSGWSAAISCVPKTPPTYAVNTGSVTTCTGTFTDNGGSNAPYMDFSDDIFTICSDDVSNPYVTVNFSALDLWTNYDFLRVYDGTTTAAPLIGTYTGILAPFSVSSGNVSGCLTFHFTSDLWTQRMGWTASIGCSPIIGLPVEWLGFSGERSGEAIDLSWKTATETNSWYFAVERYNGTAFDSIGAVTAAGNSTQPLSYSFADYNASSGWNYYRLKQVDINGQYDYSAIVAVGPSIGTSDVSLHYDKSGEAQLLFQHLEELPLSVRIYEVTGAMVSETDHTPQSAYDPFAIDERTLAPGIYLLDVSAGSGFHKVLTYVKE